MRQDRGGAKELGAAMRASDPAFPPTKNPPRGGLGSQSVVSDIYMPFLRADVKADTAA